MSYQQPPGLKAPGGAQAAGEPEVYGYVPKKKDEEEEEEEVHLMRPSDLFGGGGD